MTKGVHPRTMLAAALAALAMGSAANAQPGAPAPAVHDEMRDRAAIEQLVTEYSYLLDHGRATEIAALFTPDGIFENPNLKLRAVGREAIAAYYARRAADPRTTRHVSTNLRLAFETPDRARGTRLITYYRGDGAGPPFPARPGSVGEYEELFVRDTDGRWRFAWRKNSLIFRGSGRQPARSVP